MGASRVIGYEFHRLFYADLEKHEVLWDGKVLERPLTSKEFDVLAFFLQHANEVIPREKVEPLQDAYHGREPVDDYLSKIKNKLGSEGERCFRTVRKIGYEFIARVQPRYALEREDAGSLYQASQVHFNQQTRASLTIALDQSAQAMRENPRGLAESHITRAYVLINLCHDVMSARLPSECMPEAQDEAKAALDSDQRAGALGILGLIALIYDYDWVEAEKLMNEALVLDPRHAATLLSLAHLLISKGDRERGLDAIDRAVRSDPTDQIIYASWGWPHLLAGDSERAVHLGEQAIQHFPLLPPAHFMLGQAYEALKKADKAIASYERALELEIFPGVLAALGHIHGTLGHRKRAESYLRRISQLHEQKATAYVSGYCRALVHAGLGQVKECLAALDVAYDQRCDWLMHLGVEPRWSPVRHLDRFQRLMRKVGLPDIS
jgi:tetratricopeptide (TPR) repeat protein